MDLVIILVDFPPASLPTPSCQCTINNVQLVRHEADCSLYIVSGARDETVGGSTSRVPLLHRVILAVLFGRRFGLFFEELAE